MWEDIQSLIFSFAATAAVHPSFVGKLLNGRSFFSHDSSTLEFVGGIVAQTSNGYKFGIGRFVQPVLVLICLPLEPVHLPVIRLSMTATRQLIVTSFFPLVLWNCLRDVK